MLYQPSYPKPYLTDIDATQSNNFECLINAEGGTQVIKYNLTISDLNGNQIYTSGVTSLSTPLYSDQILTMEVPSTSGMENGLDYTWKVALYEAQPNIWVAYGTIQSDPVSTSTNIYIRKSYLIQQGMYLKIQNEIREITSYDSSTGLAIVSQAFSTVPASGVNYNVYSDNVVSNDIFFQARTTPTLTINSIPDTINSKSYNFVGTYTQAEGVNYKYFQWTIYNSDGVAINTSNQIDTGAIEYYYDGFFNGETYGVSLYLENQDGVTVSTDIVYFNVSYLEPDITNSPSAQVDCNNNAIVVSWSPPLINQGIAEGTGSEPYYNLVANQPFEGGSSVNINSGASIYWWIGAENNPVNLPYESTTYFNWTVPSGDFSGTVYEQVGEYVNLLTMTNIAPAQCNTGDQYYNIKDKLIYTAIDTNQWSNNGTSPNESNMYYTLDTNTKYLWNNTTLTMSETTEDLPSYIITYSKGVFYYTITNIGVNINGSVVVADVEDKWLLQPLNADPKQIYIWNDNSNWDDDLYWTETKASELTKNWFKLILLPTELQVIANPIPTSL